LSFKLPDVLLKLRCETPRQIYSTAWALSDNDGCFPLDATQFGVPKRTLQHWFKYFKRWHLIQAVDVGGGRGRRALYKIVGKAEFFRKQQQNKLRNEAVNKDKNKKRFPENAEKYIKQNERHWLNDRQKRWQYSFQSWEKCEKGTWGYNRLAQCLRYCLWDLKLDKTTNEELASLVLSRLEGQSKERCQEICHSLLRALFNQRERLHKFIKLGQRAFSWIGWMLAKLLKHEQPENKPELRNSTSISHRAGCECIQCDRQRVAEQRAQAERAYGCTESDQESDRRAPTRQLTIQDIAQRFGLMPSQVISIAKYLPT